MSAINYIIKNKELLNITEIARKAGIPDGTLRAVVAGRRSLSDENQQKLEATLRELNIGGNGI